MPISTHLPSLQQLVHLLQGLSCPGLDVVHTRPGQHIRMQISRVDSNHIVATAVSKVAGPATGAGPHVNGPAGQLLHRRLLGMLLLQLLLRLPLLLLLLVVVLGVVRCCGACTAAVVVCCLVSQAQDLQCLSDLVDGLC